jgi:hypothetical protein
MLFGRDREKRPKPIKKRREGYTGERDKKINHEAKKRAESKSEKPTEFKWKGLKHFLETFK